MSAPAANAEAIARLLAPVREDRMRAAILTDVDGTLAPIVLDPGAATVPEKTRQLLRELARTYALVGCLSGRRAVDARRLVGLDELAYAGNHGFELLLPGEAEPRPDPSLDGHESDAARFVEGLDRGTLEGAGIRTEDKGPIVALHWRGAADQGTAESVVEEIAANVEDAGLLPHRGRKVLEIRPPVAIDKGVSVSALLDGRDLVAALYGGDDRTDVDAFHRLRALERDGSLSAIACVAVTSDESPAQVAREADLAVPGPEGFEGILELLAEP